MIPILLVGAAYLIGNTMEGKSYAKGGNIVKGKKYKVYYTIPFSAYIPTLNGTEPYDIIELIDTKTQMRNYDGFYHSRSKAAFVDGVLYKVIYSSDKSRIGIRGIQTKKTINIFVKNNLWENYDCTNTTFDGDNPDIRYNNGGILNAKKIEEIINTFYIAVGKHYKENMFSNESRSAKQRLNFANKKLNKILGFEFGKISEHTEKQKAVYNSLYELTNLIGESTSKPYDTPKELSEAYQKAILDGGNPELVNTVNKVLLNSNLK